MSARDSEFRAYTYIEKSLSDLGWDTRNPARGGDVYTQGEFRGHDSLLLSTLGRQAPEDIVRISFDGDIRYWIIEAKAERKDLPKALSDAKKYATLINQDANGKNLAPFITGVAGSPDDVPEVETYYWDGQNWDRAKINSHETTGFLSLEQCQDMLRSNSADIDNFDDDPDRFLKKARAINKTLHDNNVAVGDRAKVMGALLLALAYEGHLTIHVDPTRMIQEVNNSIEAILRQHDKEEFALTIKLTLPATDKNHKKFRKAIVDTIQHLREMNVRSAINSGDDALGKFYETFLKYTKGAKDMGIVLTPRHITELAVEALDINYRDRVFDPTCGTGGFLVSAMDHIRKTTNTAANYDEFKQHGVWGVESEDPVYGLALVNMIFRGDGKSGLQDGSCFQHQFSQEGGRIIVTLTDKREPTNPNRAFTKVLMNPPFSQATPETDFVDYALEQCKPEALLFAVLPYSIAEGQDYAIWRKQTMKRHRVRALLKLDKNLFYPVTQATYAFILEAHVPHQSEEGVFMSFVLDDKSRPRPSKVLSEYSARDNMEVIREDLRDFLLGKSVTESIPKERIITKINTDDICSFAPEAYIKNQEYSEHHTDIIHRTLKFREIKVMAKKRKMSSRPVLNLKKFALMDFIEREVKPPLDALKNYPSGNIPVVSATAQNNGVAGWKNIPEELQLENLISVSHTHNTKPCQAFWHPYSFSAINTVHLIEPVADFLESQEAIIWLCQSIYEANSWRYDYSRIVKLNELEVFLPTKSDGSIDFYAIESASELQWPKD